MLLIGRNAAWLLGCRIGADLLNFVLFLIVSRQFGPEGMGEYAYGFAVAGFIYSAATLGIDEYGIREYTRRPASQRAGLMSDLLGAQACIAVVALLLLAAYLLLTEPVPAMLVIIASLTLHQLCAAFAGTLFVPSMASQQMTGPAVITLLCRALALVFAGAAIWIGHASLQFALSGFAIAGVLLIVLAARVAASRGVRLRPHLSVAVIRNSARTLWSFAAVDVMGQLFTRIGVIALSLQMNKGAAGIYATGLKLAEVTCLPLLFIGVAAYPRLCEAFRDPAQFKRLSRQALWLGLALAFVSALALYLAVPILLVPVLGPRYAGTESIIASMAALVFVQGAEIVLGRLLLAAHLNVARAAWISIGALACVIATIATIPAFGIEAAVVAVVLAYLMVDVLYAVSLYGRLRQGGFGRISARPRAHPETRAGRYL